MPNVNIDPTRLGDDILDAVRGVIDGDLPELRDFVTDQLDGIAEQTVLVAKGVAAGWIDTEEERAHWAKTLKDMATEFAKTLRALVVIAIEKAVNAIIGVLQGAIKAAVGVALPF